MFDEVFTYYETDGEKGTDYYYNNISYCKVLSAVKEMDTAKRPTLIREVTVTIDEFGAIYKNFKNVGYMVNNSLCDDEDDKCIEDIR